MGFHDTLEGKRRCPLEELPGAEVVFFKPTEQVCAVIVRDDEVGSYLGLVHNVTNARAAMPGTLFQGSDRTLELALYESAPDSTFRALMAELGTLF